jgi:murein DD-endopeptidase MepM/ murein hydrolase activator NlpD
MSELDDPVVVERARVHPLLEIWFLYRTTRRVLRAGLAADPAQIAGNHVIVRIGDVFALYAHLVPGSVAVRAGDRVGTGQVIGKLGHSGNSTAPHLHFHLMDSAEPGGARGVPCAFATYLTRRESGWEPVHVGIPRRFERVRSVDQREAAVDL